MITLYGTSWCGWTQEQRRVVRGMKGIRYVNCDRGCKGRMDAWPMWEVDGVMHPGFRPKSQVKKWLAKKSKRKSNKSSRRRHKK